MLAFFITRKAFYKLRVSLVVDLEAKAAEITVTYDRFIQRHESVPLWEVDTPEKADKYLSRPCGEHGNFIEYTEWLCRSGLMKKAA